MDLLDTATAYFAAGMNSNEFCVWAISEPITETDAKNALRLPRFRTLKGIWRPDELN